VREAIDQGFDRYVMDIIPNTWPDFLPDQAAFLKNRRRIVKGRSLK